MIGDPLPGLPGAQTFGLITSSAPPWAFEDRAGCVRDRAVVRLPGRLVLSSAEMCMQEVLAQLTLCNPGDAFCDLTTALKTPDEQTFAIPVSTFGRVTRYLRSEGERVRPGEPLFEFS